MTAPALAHWYERAACADLDPEIFMPPHGSRTASREAQAICIACPVRINCLEANLQQREGIWGGTTERDRRWIRQRVSKGDSIELALSRVMYVRPGCCGQTPAQGPARHLEAVR